MNKNILLIIPLLVLLGAASAFAQEAETQPAAPSASSVESAQPAAAPAGTNNLLVPSSGATAEFDGPGITTPPASNPAAKTRVSPFLPMTLTPTSGGFTWHLAAVAGVEAVTGDNGSSKFQEYREIPSGLFLESLHLFGEEPGGHYVDFYARDIGQQDQEGLISGGRWGEYSLYASFNKLPHLFSNHSRLIFQRNGTVFTLPDAVQADFIAIATDPTDFDPVTPGKQIDRNAFGNLVNGLARPFPLRMDRETWTIGGYHDLTPTIDYYLKFSDEHRTGTKPIGTTFYFTNQNELPEPIDYHTRDVNAGAEYHSDWGAVQVGYWGQFFSDANDSLTWDNPISLVDAVGAPAHGRLALPPSNQSHTVTLSGALDLPHRSRLVGTFSGARWLQDENLLPNTINSVLVSPLPITSPNLRIDTFLGNLLFTSQLTDQLSLSAGWRRYRMRDRRASIDFEHVTADTLKRGLVENTGEQPTQFFTDTMNANLSYRVRPNLTLDAGWDRDVWHRTGRDIRRSAENTLRVGANYFYQDWLSVRAFHRMRDRKISPYQSIVGDEQAPELRKYDEAARDRQETGIVISLTPNDRLQADIAFNSILNDYDKSELGLVSDNATDLSLDLGYAISPRTNGYLGVSRELNHSHLWSRFRPVVSGEPVDDPLNDWESFQRDRNWTAWLGANHVFVPNRWDGDLSISYTSGRGQVRARGVPGGAPQGEATDFPDVHFRYLALQAYGRYHVSNHVKVRLGYRYERYRERDFALDVVAPYMGFIDPSTQTSTWLAAKQPSYTAHVFSAAVEASF